MGLFDKILDDVLGFDPPKQVTGQVSSLTPNQKGLEKALSQLLLGQTGNAAIGQPGRTFPGSFSTGASPLQQQAFAQAPGVASGVQQNLQSIANPSQGQSPIEVILAGGQGFLEDKLKGVEARFGEANATSSSGARDAISRVLEQFTMASQAQALPYAQNQQQQQIQANMGLLDLQNFLSNLGGQQRGIASEQLLGERQQFELQDPLKSAQIQLALGLLGGQFAEPFTTTKTPLATQLLGSIVGGAGQGAGQFAGMAASGAVAGALSDESLKTNIKTQGLIGGMRVVTWTWNDAARERHGLSGEGFGLIAQDVAKKYPGCTVEIKGNLAIDYAKLMPKLKAA